MRPRGVRLGLERQTSIAPAGVEAERETELKETGRVEAFSDGVFAIAITLLVLDLHLPSGDPASSEQDLVNSLLHLWPQYLAFITSFAFIGIMWLNHHRLFSLIARSNTVLLLLNLLLLLGVTVLPFPTIVLSQNLGHPGERVAAIVYNAWFVGIAIFFNVLWRYASAGNRLLDKYASRAAVRRITVQYAFGPVYYLLALVLAFFSVPLSTLLDLLLALFFALPGPPVTVKLPRD